jgi:amidohydrolase
MSYTGGYKVLDSKQLDKEISGKINEIIDDIIKIRRTIHQNPELGYEEYQTSELVARKLESYGIKVARGVGGTGVVGLLAGAKPGKTLLLRADMDALPIQEETGLPFASKVPGKMHACGHDIHTSVLLGAARVLSLYRDRIYGNIKFMFQPAEECSPTGGAKKMIEDGVLENPKVDFAIALHVWPDLHVGQLGFKTGPVSARSDRIFLKVLGKSGHASAPHQGVDAIVASAQVISSLQTIISRRINPRDSVVITIGKIQGGDRYNVICDKVEMEGTVRIMSPGYDDKIPELIRQAGEGAAASVGARFEMDYINGYPMTINDEALTKKVEDLIKKSLGEGAIKEIPLDAGGEDFSFVSQKVPSVYIKLGSSLPVSSEDVGFIPLHNSRVIFDEGCISVGIKTFGIAALGLLSEQEEKHGE